MIHMLLAPGGGWAQYCCQSDVLPVLLHHDASAATTPSPPASSLGPAALRCRPGGHHSQSLNCAPLTLRGESWSRQDVTVSGLCLCPAGQTRRPGHQVSADGEDPGRGEGDAGRAADTHRLPEDSGGRLGEPR